MMSCLNPGSCTPQLDISLHLQGPVSRIHTGVSKRWSGQARAGWARPRVCLGTSKAGHVPDEKFWRDDPFLKNHCRVIVEELRPWQDFLLSFCDLGLDLFKFAICKRRGGRILFFSPGSGPINKGLHLTLHRSGEYS